MATNENLIPIPGRLHSVATEGHVAGADEIYDDNKGKLQSVINSDVDTALGNKIPTLQKGAANGVATLDSGGKVPSTQLPSYVDDVLEYNNRAAFPATGEKGKIYVAKDTNISYRWSGSAYIAISNPYSPDEEDLTVVNDLIKLKDNHATTGTTGDYPYNGMGRVILRKNMVSGVNTLTQSMMPVATGGNTVYVIKYDYVLGEDITIPENCVLEFDGGSISGNGNGKNTITSNQTLVRGLMGKKLTGLRVLNGFIYQEAQYNSSSDNITVYPLACFGDYNDNYLRGDIVSEAFQKSNAIVVLPEACVIPSVENVTFRNAQNLTIKGESASSKVVCVPNVTFSGYQNFKIEDCIFDFSYADNHEKELFIADSKNVTVSGVTVQGLYGTEEWFQGGGLYVLRSRHILIERCNFYNCFKDAILVNNNCQDITIVNNNIKNCVNIGIEIEGRSGDFSGAELAMCYNAVISGNRITNTNDCGICVNFTIGFVVSNNIITTPDRGTGINIFQSEKGSVSGNIVRSRFSALNLQSELYCNVGYPCLEINVFGNYFESGAYNNVCAVSEKAFSGAVFIENAHGININNNTIILESGRSLSNCVGALVINSSFLLGISANQILTNVSVPCINIIGGYKFKYDQSNNVVAEKNIDPYKIIITGNHLKGTADGSATCVGLSSVYSFNSDFVDGVNNVIRFLTFKDNQCSGTTTEIANLRYAETIDYNCESSWFRPNYGKIGGMIFYNSKPLWYKGEGIWVDATGTPV